MLYRGRQAGPEAASRLDLAVVGAGVVVGAYRRAGRYVRLASDEGSDEEARVMVLLVAGEDEVVEHLAAGDGRVVAEHRVDEPGSVLERGVGAQDEAYRLASVEYPAAPAHYTVDQLDALADLGALDVAGEYRQVLQLIGALDVGGLANRDVLHDAVGLEHRGPADRTVAPAPPIVHRIGHRLERCDESRVASAAGPEVGVGADHVPEGRNGTPARLVHEVKLDAELLGLALHDDAVAELGVVGDVDFVVG